MKKAIIVGATSGIGKALAAQLIINNYQVGITGRRSDLLNNIAREFPDKYFIRSFDVSDVKNVARHLNELVSELGGLDLLVISAGTGDENEALQFDIEKQAIDTNVTGFTCVIDWAYNYFQTQRSGHITAISSIAGLRGSRQAPAYSASKSFQIKYLEGLRQLSSKRKSGIIITDIRPGFVKTNMAKSPTKFWVAPVEKAASQIFKVIEKKRKVGYITKRWALIAWILKGMPAFLYQRL
jgi:short-subunit dehydrogenase